MSTKILITGKNSYIGSSFLNYMSLHCPDTKCFEISVRGDEWESHDFSEYECVLHVAGIAHVNSKLYSEDDYYKVNTDLTLNVAKKAKESGVAKFVFMSSIIVYNDSVIIDGQINKNTVPLSKNAYGNSKIRAENEIQQLEDETFKIVIVRPPMIYGRGSKGNYRKLSNLAHLSPIFPKYRNKRSMLYIDNLSSFLRKVITENMSGIFFPQNSEYVCTSDLVKEISEVKGRKIWLTTLLNPLIRVTISRISIINKMFSNLYYEKEMTISDFNTVDFSTSVYLTEVYDEI